MSEAFLEGGLGVGRGRVGASPLMFARRERDRMRCVSHAGGTRSRKNLISSG
jgi:hypothetical protein